MTDALIQRGKPVAPELPLTPCYPPVANLSAGSDSRHRGPGGPGTVCADIPAGATARPALQAERVTVVHVGGGILDRGALDRAVAAAHGVRRLGFRLAACTVGLPAFGTADVARGWAGIRADRSGVTVRSHLEASIMAAELKSQAKAMKGNSPYVSQRPYGASHRCASMSKFRRPAGLDRSPTARQPKVCGSTWRWCGRCCLRQIRCINRPESAVSPDLSINT